MTPSITVKTITLHRLGCDSAEWRLPGRLATAIVHSYVQTALDRKADRHKDRRTDYASISDRLK